MRLPTVEDLERRLPRPESFSSDLRGPRTTSRLGLALGLAFTVCFLTGVWSHVQYHPPAWLGPSPVWLYRVTQGLHVATGLAAIPLLLVKLWSVYPLLFARPPAVRRDLLLHLIERATIAVLVASSIFQLATGVANILKWYPWAFSFRATHFAVAWLAVGALLVHIGVKLPVIRAALTAPLADDRSTLIGRRTLLAATAGAVATVTVATVGQTVPFLRRVSVLSPRAPGGPQGLPVNRTADQAGARAAALDPGFVVTVTCGDRQVTLTRSDLAALPQRTHRLPIACVEGWSADAMWTGPSVRDVIALAGASAGVTVRVGSMQTRGAFATTELPPRFVADHRTLLALELDGRTLDVDHGFPCRIIAPNRPGVLQTKWVDRLEVVT